MLKRLSIYLLPYILFSQLQLTFKDSTGFQGKLLAYPILSYTSETRLAYGVGGRYFYRKNPKAKLSALTLTLAHTQNSQILAILDFRHEYQQNYLSGQVSYKKFPTSFFGIGASSIFKNEEKYTPITFFADVNYDVEMAKNTYLGSGFIIQHASFDPFKEEGLLIKETRNGLLDHFISGMKLSSTYDSRDHKFNTFNGFYGRGEFQLFSSVFGSEFTFRKLILDTKYFKKVHKYLIWANQLKAEFSSSETPFLQLPQLGGLYSLRGLTTARFVDTHAFFIQSEARYKLSGKLGLIGFIGAGSVNNNISFDRASFVYGIGGRYYYPGKERLTLRADIGFSEDGAQIYLGINEAF